MYTCIAFTNAPQRSEDRATVIVDVAKGVPFPPSDLKITSCYNRTTIITWTKGKDNDAPITHFVVEQESTYFPEEWHVIANITDPTKTSFTLKLTAWANMTFRMRAINSTKIGPSRASMPTPKGKCVTIMFRPLMYPRNFRGVPGKAGELDIAWTPMTKLEANGPGLHYILRYRKVLKDRRKLAHWVSLVIRNPTLDHYSLPYAGYYQLWEFQITAKNYVGEGPISETVRSFSGQDAPKSKPGNVKIGKVSASSTELSWNRVMVSRGSVDGYNIYYWTQNKATPQVLKFMSTRQAYVLKQEVTGLTPFTSYTLSITAFNSGGEGPQSDAINFDTLDDAGVTPPAITFQPNDLDDPGQAKAGTAQFILSCSATGSLPMNFRWEKSGKHLQEIPPYRTITESMFSSNVTIRTLEPFDDGKYQCFVNNPAGGTFSRKLRLKVTETSPFKEADTVEKPVNVTIGRPLYLACPEQTTGSRHGDFGAFYFWGIKRQFILKRLPMKANIAMLPNGDLFFTYVDQEDIKLLEAYPFNLQLQCVVMAGNSFYRSHKYNLKVVGPDAFAPAFAPGGEPKQVETAVQGKEKFLHCVASGNPAPQTRWYRVFDNINGQTREIINAIEGFLIPRANYGRVLHIPKVSKQQHEPGHYKCEVSNGVGSTLVSKLSKITVNVRPVWSVKPPTRKVVPVIGDTTLTCEAFGSPSPKLKWYHDGTEFTSDTELAPHIIVDGNKLLFKKVQKENEGVYQCAVENDWGMLVSSTWVRVKGSS